MDQWKTTLILNRLEGTLYSKQINTNIVAYFKVTVSALCLCLSLSLSVSVSVSPHLFCIVLAPLSSHLNSISYCYTASTSTNNNLSNQEQTGLLTIVNGFGDDIQMEFRTGQMFQEKRITIENIQIDLDATKCIQ